MKPFILHIQYCPEYKETVGQLVVIDRHRENITRQGRPCYEYIFICGNVKCFLLGLTVLTSSLAMQLIKTVIKAAGQKICRSPVLCGSLILERMKNIPLGH